MAKKLDGAVDDGTMSLPECANYLHLSENTVLKLAADGKLPGTLVDKVWHFQRDEIDSWLQERVELDDGNELPEIPDGMRVPLGDLLPIEGIIEHLQSTDALSVIEELAARAYSQGWLHDKPWFVGALVEREALASTAMEGGVAFLHTRAREGDRVARPFILVGRSYNGIDFGAPDGKLTFVFFLLGLKYDRLHLPILGRLARTMRDPKTIAKLRSQPSATKIRALLLKEDATSMEVNPQAPVKYEELKPKLDRQLRLRAIMRLTALRKHEEKKAQEEAKKKTKKKTSARSGDTDNDEDSAEAPPRKPAKKAAASGASSKPGAKAGQTPTASAGPTVRKRPAAVKSKPAAPEPEDLPDDWDDDDDDE